MSLRHKTSTRIFITHGYAWPTNTLNPDHLAPKQFSKMVKCLNDFACANMFVLNFVYTWLVIPVARICACVCVISENQALPLP